MAEEAATETRDQTSDQALTGLHFSILVRLVLHQTRLELSAANALRTNEDQSLPLEIWHKAHLLIQDDIIRLKHCTRNGERHKKQKVPVCKSLALAQVTKQ